MVVDIDRLPREHDLVDAVEQVAGQLDPVGGQVGLGLVHRARADDRGGHRRVADDEGERRLRRGQPGLVGEPLEVSAASGVTAFVLSWTPVDRSARPTEPRPVTSWSLRCLPDRATGQRAR